MFARESGKRRPKFVFALFLFSALIGLYLSGQLRPDRAGAAETCKVTWSKPIYDNSAEQYYVDIDNNCNFAVQVTIRNNGIDYGQYCAAGEKGLRRYVGKTLGNDYKVTAKKA